MDENPNPKRYDKEIKSELGTNRRNLKITSTLTAAGK